MLSDAYMHESIPREGTIERYDLEPEPEPELGNDGSWLGVEAESGVEGASSLAKFAVATGTGGVVGVRIAAALRFAFRQQESKDGIGE